MCVCREVPFASALLFFRPRIKVSTSTLISSSTRTKYPKCSMVGAEVMPGVATAAIAGPISHVPSVLAAYQQGHGVSLAQAYKELLAFGGKKELWRGLTARTVSLAGTFTVVPFVISQLTKLFPDSQ